VEYASRGEFAPAARRFRDALDLHHAPAVEYNLAAALYEIGRYDEAYNRTQSVLIDPETSETLRERAARLERALQPYVARLTVVIGGERDGVAVQVDGSPLDPSLVGRTRAVEAGTHLIVAERHGESLSRREVRIPKRTAAIVDVSVVASPEEAARSVVVVEAEPAPAAPIEAAPPASESSGRWKLWAGLGAGLVAVGAAVGVGIALSRNDAGRQEPLAGDTQPGVLTWK
jgi:tetratricopeptide (TPR) repeat protein